MPLERVAVAISHLLEHFVQLFEGVTSFMVALNPLDEGVFSFWILVDSWPFENGVECLLGVGLDDVLLVLHQLYDPLKDGKVTECHTQGLGLCEESDQLTNVNSQEFIPVLLHALTHISSSWCVVRKMTLFVVLVNQVGDYQFLVVQEKSFHVSAVIKEFLDDSENLVPVFEVGGEEIDIDQNVYDGNACGYLPEHFLLTQKVLRHHVQLAD